MIYSSIKQEILDSFNSKLENQYHNIINFPVNQNKKAQLINKAIEHTNAEIKKAILDKYTNNNIIALPKLGMLICSSSNLI